MYLTPARFRSMGFGVKVDDLTDAELNRYLVRAGRRVNNYCAMPDIPAPHDFRGGSIVGETHTWRMDPYDRRLSKRVFPYHTPVIDVTSSRIYVTETQYLEFSASEMYYETSEGWVEPTSAALTSYGLFGAGVLPFVGLSEPHISLDYTYGWNIPVVERIYYADEHMVWRATNGFWRPDDVVVQVNGVVRPDTDYELDRVEGTVKFIANYPVDGDTVDVSYVASMPEAIAEAEGLIAAAAITEKNLVTSGLGGLRSVRVAEVAIERDYRRSGNDQQQQMAVPPEACDLLEPYVHLALAFG